MMRQVLALFLVVSVLIQVTAADGERASDFKCTLCQSFMTALRPTPQEALSTPSLLKQAKTACAESGPFDSCAFMLPAYMNWLSSKSTLASALSANVFSACQEMSMCPIREAWQDVVKKRISVTSDDDALDIRVALPHGDRGDLFVRISVIENNSSSGSEAVDGGSTFWDYDEKFKYFWEQKKLQTAVKPFQFPQTTFQIPRPSKKYTKTNASKTTTDVVNVTVTIPEPGSGISALMIGDPCFTGTYVGCEFGEKWKIFERLTTILNTGLGTANGGVDLWFLLGDNFYDPHGILAPEFFAQLTLPAKSKPLVTVVGNHDIWQHGTPHAKSGYDTFGNGFMQYYLMDVEAGLESLSMPLNFSVKPTTSDPFFSKDSTRPEDSEWPNLPLVENFFTYNRVGNLVIVSFSGAHTKKSSEHLFRKACAFVNKTAPAFVIVAGHWSAVNFGCRAEMSTKEVHSYMITLPGCSDIAHRIKWIEGHSHCNLVVDPGVGFRLGGFGMGGCENFGIPYLTSHKDVLEIGYFPIIGGNGTVPSGDEKHGEDDTKFNVVNSCIAEHGLEHCAKLHAVVWHRQSK